MEHKLTIKHLGPINECELLINDMTVLTGPQSNGKSTVAKAVYFFRSVKQDILSIMMLGGPRKVRGRENDKWIVVLKQKMRDKFLQLFGTSWIMPPDMTLQYEYNAKCWIKVYLQNTPEYENFIEFNFSPQFIDYLSDLDEHVYVDILPNQKRVEEQKLEKLLSDNYETVFIPAGRNLITLLSNQLNYIFTSLEGSQLRNIDYVTKRYTELILKLKPLFTEGMFGIIEERKNNIEYTSKKNKHKSAIKMLMQDANNVLKGTYKYVNGEERLYHTKTKYVKINFASSGQQEIVWVFNLLFYYLLEDNKVFLIIEEPESHLYPESQEIIAKVLGLFVNEGNSMIVTTHSPYVLGTFNYMLLASQTPKKAKEIIKEKLHKRYWINPQKLAAYQVENGTIRSALDNTDALTMIDNSLIDGASDNINDVSMFIADTIYEQEHAND